MSTTKTHYDELLGPVYAWMVGDFEAAAGRNAALFARIGIAPRGSGRAVDLGAGHGVSAVPLAGIGFDVTAIDFCRPLLDGLEARGSHLQLRGIEGDLLELERLVPAPVEVIVCLGDTLPHLPDRESVERLLTQVHDVLEPGGRFVATFRDYVTRELEGTARFIPVKADDTRILTCVLEYGREQVTVFDLLHERDNGTWRQQVSSYRKIRLDPDWLTRSAAAAGLEVDECGAAGGLVTFVARR